MEVGERGKLKKIIIIRRKEGIMEIERRRRKK